MKNYHHIKQFGSTEQREAAINKSGGKCVICSMTREQHLSLFNVDITVDHVDGLGRNNKNPNNDLSNLQTLCLRCHGSKDGKRADYSKRRSYAGQNHPRAKITNNQANEIIKMRNKGIKCTQLATKYSLALGSIYRILNRGII